MGSPENGVSGKRVRSTVVERKAFIRAFENSYGAKAVKPKIIIKGLNLLDGCLDEAGDTIPGKTTLMLTAGSIGELKLPACDHQQCNCVFLHQGTSSGIQLQPGHDVYEGDGQRSTGAAIFDR